MKKTLLAFVMIVSGFTSSGFAAEVPHCWRDGGEDVVDGDYLVSFDASKMSKEQLLVGLQALQGRNIRATDFPIIFGSRVVVRTQAVDYGVGQHRLSLPDLQQAVKQELAVVAKLPGASISCNGLMHPFPGMGVRN